MRHIFLSHLVASAAPLIAHAAVLDADFETDRGMFTVVLEQEHTPLATANLVRLSGGGVLWRDPENGALKNLPIYDGVVVDAAGSSPGQAFFEFGDAGAPGYEFPDEFHPNLGHQPYVVAMAADAPNTNGARIRVYGALADASRDGRDTVFGLVPPGPGRAVVDSIIAAGPGATEILRVIIRGRDAWEATPAGQSIELPELQAVPAALAVVSGTSSRLVFSQPPNTVFAAHASADLLAWEPWVMRFLDGDSPGESSVFLDAAELPRRFYYPSLAVYPGEPPGVAWLADSTLDVEGPGFGLLRYHFDASGLAGTYENIVSLEPPPLVFGGNFTVIDPFGPRAMPHSLRVLVSTPGLGGADTQMIEIGWNGTNAQGPEGRHIIHFLDASMNVVFTDEGPAALIRN